VVDWGLAQRVGGFVAATGGTESTHLAGDLEAATREGHDRVTAYTGLTPARAVPPPERVDRQAWLEANLRSMRTLMTPVTDKLAARSNGVSRAVGGTLLGVEIGALTGYLAQRVLGQYELVLLDPTTDGAAAQDGAAGGGARSPERLLFVAPNLRETARRLEVDEGDLVAWVAFHEVTHAVQFTGVPWLRDHLGGLMRELLASMDVKVDPTALLRTNADDLRALVERAREGGLVTLVAGPERMAIIDRIQNVMAVIEGHAEHVMDVAGADALASLPQLRAALDRRRREKPPAIRLLERLIGLELKLKQYEQGKRWCDAVVAQAGPEALHRVFSAPEALPDADELERPERWLDRVV